jgi:Chromo (CHRromatin Organisation MOdifier) domain
VTKVVSPVIFKLRLPASWKIHDVFHASLLSPYKETEEHGENFEEPPPDLIKGETEYEVDQILDMRWSGGKNNRKRQYKVQWKGYSEAHDTWEPEGNIRAPDCLKEFIQRHPKKALAEDIKAKPKGRGRVIIQSIQVSFPMPSSSNNSSPTSPTTPRRPVAVYSPEDRDFLAAIAQVDVQVIQDLLMGRDTSPISEAPSSPRYVPATPSETAVDDDDDIQEIPRLPTPPRARILSPVPERAIPTPVGFHHYEEDNPHDYSFTMKDAESGGFIEMEFVKFTIRDDSYITRYTKTGDGPFEAPLNARSHPDKETGRDDLVLFHPTHVFHRTVDDTLRQLGDPGLTAEVQRYRWTVEEKERLKFEGRKLGQNLGALRRKHEDSIRRLGTTGTTTRLLPFILSDRADIRGPPPRHFNSPPPVVVPGALPPPPRLPSNEEARQQVGGSHLRGGAGSSEEGHLRRTTKKPYTSTHDMKGKTKAKQPPNTRCSLCRKLGHVSARCWTPHVRCPRDGKECLLGTAHENYKSHRCPAAWAKDAKADYEAEQNWYSDDYDDDVHNLDPSFWEC